MEIQKFFNKPTFNLQNKFCDAEELKNSWINVHKSHEHIHFVGHLNDIPQSYYHNYQLNSNDIEDDDNESDFTIRRVMKIKSLYRNLYYNLYDGK